MPLNSREILIESQVTIEAEIQSSSRITILLSVISSFIRCRKRSTDPHITEKQLHIPPKPETPAKVDSLLNKQISKSLPELQEEWLKEKRKTERNARVDIKNLK